MGSIKIIFDKIYNFMSIIKYYIVNNKKSLPLTIIYFIAFCWIISLFPKVTVIAIVGILFNNNLSINYAEKITTLIISALLLWNFIQAIQRPLKRNLETEPLFEHYPELEVEIKNLIAKHKIDKRVQFFVKNSEELNAEAISNLYEGIIIINSSIMCLPIDEIIAVISHELYHIKNWSNLFINREIWMLTIKFYNSAFNINEKASRNRMVKLLTLNLLTELWGMLALLSLLILSIFSGFYRVLIDEMLADKYSVDSTKSKSIANVFRKTAKKQDFYDSNNNPFDIFINKTHLPPSLRYSLIDKYHYWKYIRPNWKRNRIIIILKVIFLFLFVIVTLEICAFLIPIIIEGSLFVLLNFWNSLFDFDKERAMFAFLLLIASIGGIWNGSRLYKSLQKIYSKKIRFKNVSLTCFFICLFFIGLFGIFDEKNSAVSSIIFIFGAMFAMLAYLHGEYKSRG